MKLFRAILPYVGSVIPLAVSIATLLPAYGADVIKADNTTSLNTGGSWVGGNPLGTGDVAVWNSTVTGANMVGLGGPVSWSGIRIADPAGLVTIADATNVLTLGTAGIDMSAATQNLILPNRVDVGGASQTWNVAAGHSLQFGPTGAVGVGRLTGTAAAVITISGGGLVDLNQGGLTSFTDSNGFYNYQGKWVVTAGATLRGERNGGTAFGRNTDADAITLQGGTLAVGAADSFFGSWTWTTPITLAASTSSAIDMQLPTNTNPARSLKLMGPISGTGNVTFKETATYGSFDSDNGGFIIANDNANWAGTITIGGETENGIVGRLSSLRVGGSQDSATDTTTDAGSFGTLGTANVVNKGVLTLSHDNAWTMANTISGTGRLNIGGNTTNGSIVGANTQVVTLTGNNSYTGVTDFNQGVVVVNTLTDGGVNSPIGAASSSAANLVFEKGTLRYTGGAVMINRSFSISGGGNATIDASGTGALNFSGVGGSLGYNGTTTARTLTLSGTNTGDNTMGVLIDTNTGTTAVSLVKTGTGKWILTANNTYTGTTTISAGTLQIGNNTATGKLGTGVVSIASGAILDFFPNSATTFSVGTVLSGLGTIVKDGTGQVGLTANNSGFSGTIQINTGKLAFDSIQAENGVPAVVIGASGTLSLGAAFANASAATISSLSGSGIVDPIFGVTAGTKTLDVRQSVDTIYSGKLNGDGTSTANRILALTKSGTGTLTLRGASTYAGATTVNGGTLLLDGNGGGSLSATSALALGGGNFQVKGAAAGTSQTLGALSLTANTGSSITLDPNNGTGITLTLGNAWTRAAGSSLLFDYSSANTGTRTVATAGATTGATLTNGIYGWALVKDSAGVTGFATRVGNNITRFDDTTGTTLAIGSDSTTGNFTTLNSTYAGSNQGGTLTWTNSGALTARAVNSLTIDTTNNYGTIDLGVSSNVLTLTSGAILFKGSHDATLTGGTIGAAGSEVMLHQTGTGRLTVASAISSGSGSLTKDGAGTVTLTGTSTYTGATTVNAGKLVVSGALSGTTAVFVNNGGSLSGTGSLNSAAPVAVNAGGAVDLTGDATTGTLQTGAVSFADASTFSLEIGATTSDRLAVAGAATLAGQITLNLSLLADPTDGQSFTLLDGTASLVGYSTGARFSYLGNSLDQDEIFSVTSGAFTQSFQISYTGDGGNDVTLLAVVPEPSVAMALLGGMAPLSFRRRRRMA